MVIAFQPTPAGCVLAGALVVAGAPVFAAGLRALRLRGPLRRLAERPLDEAPDGLVLVRGRVALDSPLVGPVSGRPCTGFRLEVRRGTSVVGAVEERRAFRLVGAEVKACVLPQRGTWDAGERVERTWEPGSKLSENLTALLARAPEVLRLHRNGVTLTLVERALCPGADAWVVGQARSVRSQEAAGELEMLRTGTDGAAFAIPAEAGPEPDLWIEADGHLELLHVSDEAPDCLALRPAAWRTLGLAIGPALTLAGLVYLALAAERLRGAF